MYPNIAETSTTGEPVLVAGATALYNKEATNSSSLPHRGSREPREAGYDRRKNLITGIRFMTSPRHKSHTASLLQWLGLNFIALACGLLSRGLPADR
ncbi:hypothetical protein J6590_001852 [Homalodisca vitripennis]|nr:hypothetical protein J6590_001852 [Homalodisca vitripennis]